jgi:RimJ/RimL family protein N-acetyltransferase
MEHSISLACVRYRLRPVTLDDAAFIVELRSDLLLNRYLHEISPRVEDQVGWLQRYFARPDDYYFIVEDTDSGERHGTIGIYDFEENAAGAQWGRWILKRGSMAALESAWLICEAGFSKLRVASLSSRTLVENGRVVSFHDSFGACRVGVLVDHFLVGGERKSAVEHRIEATNWPALRSRHYSTVSRLARRAFQ